MKTTTFLLATLALPIVAATGCSGDGGENDSASSSSDSTTDTDTTDGTDSTTDTTDSDSDGTSGGTSGGTDSAGTGGTDTSSSCAAKGETDSYELVNADINEDTTWRCDKVYVLAPDTHVFVNGAVLTIEPGTTVLGNTGSALVIEKDSRLLAEGTADQPIAMTSFQDTPARGDWGGLVLLGDAPVNLAGGTGVAEGFVSGPTYGGTDDAHDCGSLAYLRVEYAGFAISDGNELNGITFYACGTATSAHHVQSHMGADDGIECFGGGFDMDHIVITGEDDDALDLDQGYQGTIQYVAIHQATDTGNFGFEWSNQGNDFTATPLTSPTVCNATVIGSAAEKSAGATFKEGNEAAIHSSIFTNAGGAAITLANIETETVAMNGGIVLQNNIFFGNGTPAFVSSTGGWDDAAFEAWVLDAAKNNLTDDPGLGSVTWGAADFAPGAVVDGAGAVPSVCEDNDYIGAVDPNGDNWLEESWINWTP